jgi:hypothetical protein
MGASPIGPAWRAILAIAGLTFVSGVIVAVAMREPKRLESLDDADLS